MLDEIRLWFRANANKLKAEPLLGKLRRYETEDETLMPPLYSAGFDLKSEKILASFGVWETGDLSVIIMDNETATEVLVDDRKLDTPQDLQPILDHYSNQIIRGGPFTKYEVS